MVLHLPHPEGGFRVTFNSITTTTTKDAAFYTSTSRFVAWLGTFPQGRQAMWMPQDDLQDSSSWSSPPLVVFRRILATLSADCDCKDSAPTQSQTAARARGGRSSQDGFSQQQEGGPLFLPQLNCLHEAFHGGRIQRCRQPHPDSKQAYQPYVQALEAVSSPLADLRGRTTRRTAPPSPATAHRRHCRGLCPAYRDGRTRASGGKCPQAYPVVQAHGLAWCDTPQWGQRGGDIELAAYLADTVGPSNLVAQQP